MTPRLSIVIPAYNVASYVGDAIASALAQTIRDIEVIVINDGSTDGTAGVVKGFSDPRLRLVSQPNRGLSAARNAGIANAQGAFIGFLDGDDRWYPEKAEMQLAAMESDPSIGITFCHSAYIDEAGAETGRILLTGPKRPRLRDLVLRNALSNGSTPIIRTEHFSQAGNFDTDLLSCEDWEMWVRLLRETPCQALLVPEVLTAYRINTQSLSFNFEKFLYNAETAVAKMKVATPEIPDRLFARGLAMCYRIAGSKALKIGNNRAALKLFAQAVRISPSLVVTDLRLFASLASMIAPDVVVDLADRFVSWRAGVGASRQRSN